MLQILTGFLLFLWALASAGTALYTAPAFEFLSLDPVALHIANGTISFVDLPDFERDGLVFTEVEIRHLADVRSAVAAMHTSLIVLLVVLIALIVWKPRVRFGATGWALAIFAGILVLLGLSYGLFGYEATSDMLHLIYFDAGSYYFQRDTLTAQLYGKGEMLNGAAFVVALTGLALIITWIAARIPLPASFTRWQRNPAAAKRRDVSANDA